MIVTLLPCSGLRERLTWVGDSFIDYIEELAAYDAEYWKLASLIKMDVSFFIKWLEQKDLHPFIIEADGQRAGLALVTQAPFPYMSQGVDFRMGEFFIFESYRRRGVGGLAAQLLFSRFRGKWEITEIPENSKAILFWNRVIQGYTKGCYEDLLLDGKRRQFFDSNIEGSANHPL